MKYVGLGWRRLSVTGIVATMVLVAGLRHIGAQGQYAPVTESNVIALKLNHYFTPDKKSHDPDFEWKFTKTEFVVKKGKGAIPVDLMEKLLPADSTADEIRGKWKLKDKDGQQLVLSEIKAGEKAGKKEVNLSIYKTAPTVVRIGEPQYVFGVGK